MSIGSELGFDIEDWERSGLLDGMKENEKKELVPKLNEGFIYIERNYESIPEFFRDGLLSLVRRLYDEYGDQVSISDVIEEYSEDVWEEKYEEKVEEFGLGNGAGRYRLSAEYEVMDEFIEYYGKILKKQKEN